LEALAYNLIDFNGILCPVMNARRSQVYNALFHCENGRIIRLCEDRAIAIADLDAELTSIEPSAPVFLAGDGYDITLSAMSQSRERIAITPLLLRPQSAYSVAQIAYKKYLAGDRTTDSEIVPVYLRPSQAERERLERLSQSAEK
jgi:tRNA threonylcarbamoyladenosine biosynthesis protein TsaB